MSDALSLLGAHPVSMPISELHSALDKKVIDGMLSPTTGIHDFKLYDQIRHTTRLNLFNSLLMVVMNRERFAALPAEAKKALEEASGKELGLRASGIYDRLDAEVMARLRAAGKVSLDTLARGGRRRKFQAPAALPGERLVARLTAKYAPGGGDRPRLPRPSRATPRMSGDSARGITGGLAWLAEALSRCGPVLLLAAILMGCDRGADVLLRKLWGDRGAGEDGSSRSFSWLGPSFAPLPRRNKRAATSVSTGFALSALPRAPGS
jgi:hypothetical protein